MEETHEKTFSLYKNMQMANKNMKICLVSLVIRDMQAETTMRYHYTIIRIAKINSGNRKKRQRM